MVTDARCKIFNYAQLPDYIQLEYTPFSAIFMQVSQDLPFFLCLRIN